MGPDLTRIIFAFTKLLDPADLPSLKTWSNQLENAWSKNGSRRVNIDVGYVSLAKLVLASTKDHAHRLYLGQGIYGEVTLYYAGGEFQPWPWTYPDYASLTYRKIFGTIREQHRLLRGQRNRPAGWRRRKYVKLSQKMLYPAGKQILVRGCRLFG